MAKCLQAREMAYCPYSKFPVGAAILTTGGAIVTGRQIHLLLNFICSNIFTIFILSPRFMFQGAMLRMPHMVLLYVLRELRYRERSQKATEDLQL